MTNETHATLTGWTRRFFAGADSSEPAFFEEFVDADIRLVIGHNDAIVGRDNLKAAYQSVSGILETIRHNVLDVHVSSDTAAADHVIAAELSIDYKLKNGTELTLPCVNILSVKDGKAIEQKVFMDACTAVSSGRGLS